MPRSPQTASHRNKQRFQKSVPVSVLLQGYHAKPLSSAEAYTTQPRDEASLFSVDGILETDGGPAGPAGKRMGCYSGLHRVPPNVCPSGMSARALIWN